MRPTSVTSEQQDKGTALHWFTGMVVAAACDCLAFEKEKDYDPAHVMLPYVEVIDVDAANPEDVLVYGDYYLWEFEKQDDTLVVLSGGHRPGILHMERFVEGDTAVYSALSVLFLPPSPDPHQPPLSVPHQPRNLSPHKSGYCREIVSRQQRITHLL